MIELFRSLFTPPRHMILVVAAAWFGLALAEKRAARYKVSAEALNNLVFFGMIAFILGGRILFSLGHLDAFLKSPLSLFALNPDLFDALGGSLTAALTMFIYGQRQNLDLWNTLDALTPFFASLAVGLGLSHLAAGTAFGKPTDLPWAINLWNENRHPSQVYEIIASFLTFGLAWFLKPNPRPGLLFLTFAAATAALQLFLGAYRGDSTLVLGSFHLEQVTAWAVLAAAFGLIEWRTQAQ
jgi:phosphatidylglycerol:prolipoprotein diacylglycerol transferase